MMENKNIILLGIRGIPAKHGGFETFAENLSLYLVNHDWEVTVYCQEEGSGSVYETEWEGIKRVHIPVSNTGPLGTIIFDFKSILHSLHYSGVFLTLGYNTAIFNLFYRVTGKRNIINMDGIEWKRQKWGKVAKAWFWLNERFGCWFGHHLIADHPEIKNHLSTRISEKKITVIPYGAELITQADIEHIKKFGLQEKKYCLVIARPEPENSILEIVKAFSKKKRNMKLVVLGNFEADKKPYQQSIMDAASDEVIFPGAIYEKEIVEALRFYTLLYLHGHTVGGTNPSLVEALGAGSPVIAHDNKYNRWVIGYEGAFFKNEIDLSSKLDDLLSDQKLLEKLSTQSCERHQAMFTQDLVHNQYKAMLENWITE
jgi:glycosyltransferase involved in cell wall biosynthesis